MNIILAGGGTAGHVTPALAVIDEILKDSPKSRVLFIGRAGGRENDAVIKAGTDVKTLKIQGLKRKICVDNLKSLYCALKAEREAKKIIREFSPDVILGTGGYVCWPVIRAGASLKIPTAIHESNFVPGLTTKILSGKCDAVLINHDKTREYLKRPSRAITVGNPIRGDFGKISHEEARRRLGIKNEEFFILSVGGSIGAQELNKAAIGVMEEYSSKQNGVRHIHATGQRYFADYKSCRFAIGESRCKIIPYIDDMPTMLTAADLVISRSGAMTISEICRVGVPSILIPSPNVTDNHQFKNAKLLSDAGAARLIEEKNLSKEVLKNAIIEVKSDKNRRKNRAKIISAFSTPDAAKRIKTELERLISAPKN